MQSVMSQQKVLVDVCSTKLQEDLNKSNVELFNAKLEIIILQEALVKSYASLYVANMEITELQVDFNTNNAILEDTKDDLKDVKADLCDAQTKIDHVTGKLKWEIFFNGLEAADYKQEVADAKQEALDARQKAADVRRKCSLNIRQKRTMGTRSTPVAKRRK
jgi:predicted  nucleic acid-binding Zn-ribbon protein